MLVAVLPLPSALSACPTRSYKMRANNIRNQLEAFNLIADSHKPYHASNLNIPTEAFTEFMM